MEKSATWAIVSLIIPATTRGRMVESAPLQYSQISPAVSFTITDILFRSVRRGILINTLRYTEFVKLQG